MKGALLMGRSVKAIEILRRYIHSFEKRSPKGKEGSESRKKEGVERGLELRSEILLLRATQINI